MIVFCKNPSLILFLHFCESNKDNGPFNAVLEEKFANCVTNAISHYLDLFKKDFEKYLGNRDDFISHSHKSGQKGSKPGKTAKT